MTNNLNTSSASSKNRSGIFPELSNSAAFIDKIVLNVEGVRRKRPPERIRGKRNLAIGGLGAFYARCLLRWHSISGNPIQLKYGLLRNYRNLSEHVLTIRANGSPITAADVLLVLDGLMRRGYKAVISSLELTFDVTGIPLWRLGRELCSRAQTREVRDRKGNTTLYVGAPASPIQIRIYQKTDFIVRVEFILRSSFLRRNGIRSPQDALLLKTLDLWQGVSFRDVNSSSRTPLPPRVRNPWKIFGPPLPPPMPASIILRELRQAHVDPGPWIVQSEHENLLRKMQKNLIF